MGGILHFHSQRTTAQKMSNALIFNAFFMCEGSEGRLERRFRGKLQDRPLETDFLNLVKNAPDLLG